MCGRYALYGPISRLRDHFGLQHCVDFGPRYNITPQSDILVIRDRPGVGRVGVIHRWGLIPSWAKAAAIGAKLHNARAETVAEKPAFRASFRRLRCLIPANGFYEWQTPSSQDTGRKQPFYATARVGDFVAMAGLVDCWQDGPDSRVLSVAVITTVPNAVMAPIHDRMPVILDQSDHDAWLDVTNHDVHALKKLLVPAPDGSIQAWRVGAGVNRAGNEGPELIVPV
jgi:putative SOS response-associated peptidase YedK